MKIAVALLFSLLVVIEIVFCKPYHETMTNLNVPDFTEFKESLKDGDTDKRVMSVIFDEQAKSLVLKNGTVNPYVAVAVFKNTMNSTGWSLLQITTNGSYDDMQQSEAAGLIEGYITADHISMHFQNTMADYCTNDKEFCDKLKDFMKSNTEYLENSIKNDRSSYWYQVSLIQKQLEGLQKGYEISKTQPAISAFEMSLLQMFGDLEDLEQALGKKSFKKVLGSGSCSALVKLFPKNQDLAISQVTWDDFNGMLRVYKFYNFSMSVNANSDRPISGQVQSFSSSPGLLFSGDDFYILSSGLVSQETTIGNSNADLWKYVSPGTVMEWTRSIVANRLASTGNEWCSLFERHNSGTYNNQWMVLDYKLFEVGKELKPDTLWILEQLPGTVHMADMTVLLEKQGYWASYNSPYFPFIYNMSGAEASREKFGDWFDYNKTPRAQIFHRDQHNVVDMQSLVKLMRYNDFTKDPLSKCNCTPPYSAENAISARSDLNPKNGTYGIPALGHRRHGGTDCKATNSQLARTLSQFVVAGPTWDQQPPFQWSKTEWKKPLGHPDIFKFEPSLLDWTSDEWINPDN